MQWLDDLPRQAARLFMDVSSGSFYVSAAALAQDTASVTGTVTDSSGAAVPNA